MNTLALPNEAQNLTSPKPTLEALRTSEIRYRRLFESARDGILILNAVTLRITDVNPFMTELLGYSRTEFLGKELWEIGLFSDKEASKSAFRTLQETGYLRYEDLPLRTRHGQSREVEFVSNVYEEDGTQVIQCNIRDITERKRSEKAGRATEERYRTLFEQAPDGIVIADRESYYIDANASMCRMLGYTRDELIGLHASDIVAPTEIEHIGEDLTVIKAKSDYCREWQFKRQDGSVFAGEVIATVMPDGNLLAMIRDVTERQQGEEDLRQREIQLAEAQHIAHVGSWNLDLHTNTLTWSDEHYHIFGLEPQAFDSSYEATVEKYIHPADRDLLRSTVAQTLRTQEPFDFHYRVIRPDGRLRIVHSRGKIVTDDQRNSIRMFGTAQDVTELKEAEESQVRLTTQLESQRQRLDNIIASVPGIVWEAWSEPDADAQRINFVSGYVQTMLGYSIDEWLASPSFWLSIVHPDDRLEAANIVAASLAGGKSSPQEFRWIAKDGSVVWVESNYAVVTDEDGRPVGLRGVTLDITARTKLEGQLRQAQKMEAIGTLAGGIAHDFNNILAAIIGYSELAQLGITEGELAHGHLEHVLKASIRARDLVRQILTFSRQEEHEPKALQLQPIIDETLKLLRVSLPAAIEIRQDIDSAAPSVLGDRTQIQQVIMNLCMNAGHAMKEGDGVLEIRLTHLNIDSLFANAHPELKEGPHVRLTISDTGCGMDRATKERIFDPFFTTKAPGEGTGLGLAVVHGVVKNHGGAIAVYSEPQVGTTFDIYLPVYDGQPGAEVHKSVLAPRGNGEHILFVDDEEALVALGKSMLEHLGYRVTTSTDGVEALATFRSQPGEFDLVITDQTMPRMNGGDLAQLLLQIRPALPVILATGYSSTMSPDKAKVIGIRELLFKPNTMQALGEAIQRALGQSQKD